MTLLSTSNAKLAKTNGKTKYLITSLMLAPARMSGRNVCKHHNEWCSDPCVAHTGHGSMPATVAARIRRTNLFFDDRDTFAALLAKDLFAHIRKCEREGLVPCVRLNTFSDIPWERTPMLIDGVKTTVIDAFADDVVFYDYTKYPVTERVSTDRYHLTYSASGFNMEACMDALSMGHNIAVVFDTLKGEALPRMFHGFPVVDGDASDLRFLDPAAHVVGLRAKAVSNARLRAMVKTPFVYSATGEHVEV
jgi:hypothetical protein